MMKSAILLVLVLLPVAASAFRYDEDSGCRSGRPIRSHVGSIALNTISFPQGGAFENAFIESQNEDSFATAGSFWRQGHTSYNSPWITIGNGRSEAAFIHLKTLGIPNPAVTFWQYASAWSWGHWCVYFDYMNEADVLFDVDSGPWDPGLLVTPAGLNVKAVAQHELLHSAGFEHEPRVVATMGAGSYAYFGENRDVPLLHSDDKAGLRFLYGNGTAGTDVAVTAWKQVDFSPEYGKIAPVDSSRNNVQRPNPAFVEATIENHGTATVDTDLAVYVRVPPAGPWMKVETYTMKGVPPGYVWTWPLFFSTAGLPAGIFDVRVVINDSGALQEMSTVNNDFIAPGQISLQ